MEAPYLDLEDMVAKGGGPESGSSAAQLLRYIRSSLPRLLFYGHYPAIIHPQPQRPLKRKCRRFPDLERADPFYPNQ